MGAVHANHYRNISGVEISIFDNDPERARNFADRFQIEPAATLDGFFGSVEAVDICVPTDFHKELALKAIACDLPVLVEKPMAGNLKDAEEMIEAADRAGVPLMPGQVVRFFAEFERANQIVNSGELGEIASVRTRRGGAAPQGAGGWFRDLSRSGGVLVDLAVHDFDWMRWTFGEVKSVFSTSVGLTRDPALEFIGDYSLTTLSFESGIIGHVEATWMDPSGFRTTIEVCGSEGMIEYDSRTAASIATHLAGVSRFESPLASHDDPYFRQLSAFVAAVRNEKPIPVTAQDGFRALAIAVAAVESVQTGKPVAPARG